MVQNQFGNDVRHFSRSAIISLVGERPGRQFIFTRAVQLGFSPESLIAVNIRVSHGYRNETDGALLEHSH